MKLFSGKKQPKSKALRDLHKEIEDSNKPVSRFAAEERLAELARRGGFMDSKELADFKRAIR